jgi:50S ribosomal protein L16 3-hydroxylase
MAQRWTAPGRAQPRLRQNRAMIDPNTALRLLGGLSPERFMRLHWQKKPLLVRQAWPDAQPPLARAALFDLAGSGDVESRLIVQDQGQWRVRHGPLKRRALPPLSRAAWTLLVQGLDLHVPAAHAMLSRFRFLPAARLDDLMVSWASDGGGVGPHTDSYDVFLLQVQGRRRWRVGRVPHPVLVDGAPLKLLRDFQPTQDWLLEPGDLLYLPPSWGHDGVAVGGECMTCSIGFRAPAAGELARDLLMRLADDGDDEGDAQAAALYRDTKQAATVTPGAVPAALAEFARAAISRQLADPDALARVLGELLTETKPQVWFDADPGDAAAGVALDPRSRMLYDDRHVFINGEALRAGGRDATLMRTLADAGSLSAAQVARLSADARGLLDNWLAAGWLRPWPS